MLRKQDSYRKQEIKFKDKNFQAPNYFFQGSFYFIDSEFKDKYFQAPNHFFQGSFYFIDSDFNTAPQKWEYDTPWNSSYTIQLFH